MFLSRLIVNTQKLNFAYVIQSTETPFVSPFSWEESISLTWTLLMVSPKCVVSFFLLEFQASACGVLPPFLWLHFHFEFWWDDVSFVEASATASNLELKSVMGLCSVRAGSQVWSRGFQDFSLGGNALEKVGVRFHQSLMVLCFLLIYFFTWHTGNVRTFTVRTSGFRFGRP